VTDLIVVSQTAHWQRLKLLVLDSVSSPITRRVYNLGLNEFFEWYGSEPRPGFTKATVSAWEYNRVVVTLRAPRTIVWPCCVLHSRRHGRSGRSAHHSGDPIRWAPVLMPMRRVPATDEVLEAVNS